MLTALSALSTHTLTGSTLPGSASAMDAANTPGHTTRACTPQHTAQQQKMQKINWCQVADTTLHGQVAQLHTARKKRPPHLLKADPAGTVLRPTRWCYVLGAASRCACQRGDHQLQKLTQHLM
jgi:hypothetical protein